MNALQSQQKTNLFKKLWNRYQRIGIHEHTPSNEIRYIRAVNGMVLIIIAMLWLQLPFVIDLLPETQYILASFLIWPLIAQGVPLLNHYEKYTAARLLYSISTLFLISFVAIQLGPETVNHLFMLVAVVGLFIIFPPKDIFWLIVLIVMTAFILIFIEWYFTYYGGLLNFPPEAIITARWSSMSALFLIVIGITAYHYNVVREAEQSLDFEHRRSESLLLNILPKSIAERLKMNEKPIADKIEDASVLFADLIGFTSLAAQLPHERVVEVLDRLFSAFDQITNQHGLEKIKTIGDSYMVAGGVAGTQHSHHNSMAYCALDMLDHIRKFQLPEADGLNLRLGIHCGPVVAGVICEQKFAYDLWGDTVNIASRMESHGLPNRIQVSKVFFEKTKHTFQYEPRETVHFKGIGEMETYLLIGKKEGDGERNTNRQ